MLRASLSQVASILALLALGSGCARKEVSAPKVSPPAAIVKPEPKAKPEPPKRVTNRPANKDGSVFVLEYHNIGDNKSPMFRTVKQFRNDLERLYKLGFRPVTASEYLFNRMNLPPGATPVVITFDDSQPSQIKLLSDGRLDPNCAMGIWEDFARDKPDFPMKATFFVLPRMWDQPEMRKRKVQMVKSWGSELGNHTLTHPVLRKKTDEQVMKEVAGGIELLEKYGHNGPIVFAAPYGSTPKNRALIKQFKFKGKVYKIDGAFLVGSNPAPSPESDKLDLHRVPRIIAQPGILGFDNWLEKLAKGKVTLYVAP